jgi:hypothetical protein
MVLNRLPLNVSEATQLKLAKALYAEDGDGGTGANGGLASASDLGQLPKVAVGMIGTGFENRRRRERMKSEEDYKEEQTAISGFLEKAREWFYFGEDDADTPPSPPSSGSVEDDGSEPSDTDDTELVAGGLQRKDGESGKKFNGTKGWGDRQSLTDDDSVSEELNEIAQRLNLLYSFVALDEAQRVDWDEDSHDFLRLHRDKQLQNSYRKLVRVNQHPDKDKPIAGISGQPTSRELAISGLRSNLPVCGPSADVLRKKRGYTGFVQESREPSYMVSWMDPRVIDILHKKQQSMGNGLYYVMFNNRGEAATFFKYLKDRGINNLKMDILT